MEKVRIDILRLVSGDPGTGHYILVMEEVAGTRRLPIVIGTPEAQAIALALEEIKPPRPLTHDLMHNICNHFHIGLQEIVITDLKEGTFYGQLVLLKDNKLHTIDCRPSDGVALAVRFKVPIYIYENIIQEIGSDTNQSIEDEGDTGAEVQEHKPSNVNLASPRQSLSDQLAELDKRLVDALHNEDYELAAKLRDKINRMKS